MPSQLFINYAKTCIAFGIPYKFFVLWDAKIETYAKAKTIQRPMLAGEKLSAFGISMVYSPVLAPFWISNCLDKIDIYFSRLNAEEIGVTTQPSTFLGYILN